MEIFDYLDILELKTKVKLLCEILDNKDLAIKVYLFIMKDPKTLMQRPFNSTGLYISLQMLLKKRTRKKKWPMIIIQ